MTDLFAHHAYCFAGERENVLEGLSQELRKSGVTLQGDPDVRIERHELLGIGEARALSEAASRRSVSGGKKIFIIAAEALTWEAQNALLKTLEEPTSGTHFFLILPSLELLLPTLRSRLFLVAATAASGSREGEARAFLAAPPAARLKTVQTLLKEIEENGEEKTRLTRFLDALECTAAADVEQNAHAISLILEVKRYSRDRSASFKLLLEHLALVLPKL